MFCVRKKIYQIQRVHLIPNNPTILRLHTVQECARSDSIEYSTSFRFKQLQQSLHNTYNSTPWCSINHWAISCNRWLKQGTHCICSSMFKCMIQSRPKTMANQWRYSGDSHNCQALIIVFL